MKTGEDILFERLMDFWYRYATYHLFGFPVCLYDLYLNGAWETVYYLNEIKDGVFIHKNKIIDIDELKSIRNTSTSSRIRITRGGLSKDMSYEKCTIPINMLLSDNEYLTSIVNYCKDNDINIPNYSDDVKRIVEVTLSGNHRL